MPTNRFAVDLLEPFALESRHIVGIRVTAQGVAEMPQVTSQVSMPDGIEQKLIQ